MKSAPISPAPSAAPVPAGGGRDVEVTSDFADVLAGGVEPKVQNVEGVGTPQRNLLNLNPAEAIIQKFNPDMQALGQAIGKGYQAAQQSDALALLLGHTELLQDKSIPDLVMKNTFIGKAMANDIPAFMNKPFSLFALTQMLGIKGDILEVARTEGIDLNQKITPTEFLKGLGIDPHAIVAQLVRLKDELVARTAVEDPEAPKTGQDKNKPAKERRVDAVGNNQPAMIPPPLAANPLAANPLAANPLAANPNAQKASDTRRDNDLKANESVPKDRRPNLGAITAPALPNVAPTKSESPTPARQNFASVTFTDQDLFAKIRDQQAPAAAQNFAFVQELNLQTPLADFPKIPAQNLELVPTELDLGPIIGRIPLNGRMTERFFSDDSVPDLSAPKTDGAIKISADAPVFSHLMRSLERNFGQADDKGDRESEREFANDNLLGRSIAPPFKLPTNLRTFDVADAPASKPVTTMLADHSQLLVEKGGGTAYLDLKNEGLGKLALAVRLDGDNVYVKIVADSEAQRDIIGRDLHLLKDSLGDRNLQLVNVEVGMRTNQGANNFFNSNAAFAQRQDMMDYREGLAKMNQRIPTATLKTRSIGPIENFGFAENGRLNSINVRV